MDRYFYTFLLSLACWLGLPGQRPLSADPGFTQTVQINFYGAALTFSYDSRLALTTPFKVDATGIMQAYQALKQKPYQSLLTQLQAVRLEMNLDDWLYYRLIRQTLAAIYPDELAAARELTAVLLLAGDGFNLLISYRHQQLFVNAYVTADIYYASLIEFEGKNYLNLTATYNQSAPQTALYLLDYQPSTGQRAFSFYLTAWPKLPAAPQTRKLQFPYQHIRHELTVSYDQTVVDLLREYPLLAEETYLHAPMSANLAASLLPGLQTLLQDRTEREAIEMLVSFTRSSFVYGDDVSHFGRSKPMTPDELFYYPQSDCEDRAALFFALVRDLLNLPVLVIAFDDHVTVAVASTQLEGDAVEYGNQRYYYCDPTGPANSAEVGKVPESYENKTYQVIAHHKP